MALHSLFKRRGSHFPGLLLPLGCGVRFSPACTQGKAASDNPGMQYGVFLGHRLAPGGTWSGEYLVSDLLDFVDKPLAVDAGGYGFDTNPH